MKVRLEYFDQNESFAEALPVIGGAQAIEAGEGNGTWHLLTLEEPIAYGGANYDQLLIASRWAGHAISDKEPTSVFVRLVPSGRTVLPGFAVEQFPGVAWGMAHAIDV